jgi:hypothetical protein
MDEGAVEFTDHLGLEVDDAILLRDEHLTVAGFTHLRTRCGLDEAWPSYYAQRDRQDELADEIAADLGLEEVPPPPLIAICDDSPETAEKVKDYDAMLVSQYGSKKMADVMKGSKREFCGARVGLKALIEWIFALHPTNEPKNPTFRLSLDGADLAGRKAELVAIIPEWWEGNQSLHAVFPLCIYIGKESRASIQHALGEDFKEQQQALTIPQKYKCTKDRHIGIRWTFSSDLFAALKVIYRDRDECEDDEGARSCAVCDSKKLNQGWLPDITWQQADGTWIIPDDVDLTHMLFYVESVADIGICALHMNLRLSNVIWKRVLSVAVENDVKAGGSKHVDALEAQVQRAVKGFHIGRAGEWSGQVIYDGPTWPTLRGDQLRKLYADVTVWSSAVMATGAEMLLLCRLLNVVNYWISVWHGLTSRTKLNKGELQDWCWHVERMEVVWIGLQLSVTPYGEYIQLQVCAHHTVASVSVVAAGQVGLTANDICIIDE